MGEQMGELDSFVLPARRSGASYRLGHRAESEEPLSEIVPLVGLCGNALASYELRFNTGRQKDEKPVDEGTKALFRILAAEYTGQEAFLEHDLVHVGIIKGFDMGRTTPIISEEGISLRDYNALGYGRVRGWDFSIPEDSRFDSCRGITITRVHPTVPDMLFYQTLLYHKFRSLGGFEPDRMVPRFYDAGVYDIGSNCHRRAPLAVELSQLPEKP